MKRQDPTSSKLPTDLEDAVGQGIVDPSTAARLAALRAQQGEVVEDPYRPLLLGEPPDPSMTFETMIPFRVNAFAMDVARVVAEHGGARALYNPLYCYAEVGLGKTHLLSAVAHGAQGRRVLMANAADVDAELRRATRLGREGELRSWIIEHDLFLLDDVQLCEGNEALQREVFAIINHMMKRRKSVVFSSDVPPTRLTGIEARLTSRLGGGPIVALNNGDRDEREQLLLRFLGDQMPPEVVAYLADNVKDNVRRLKGAALQVLSMSQAGKVPADVSMARLVVPLPEDLVPRHRVEPEAASLAGKFAGGDRFKEMLASAETEEEQILAFQIALSERVRQLKEQGAGKEVLGKLQQALAALRDGKLGEALRWMD
jgi:chromosomal replication initiator protein